MKPARFRLPSWRQVILAVFVGVAWGTISDVYQQQKAREEYDQRYAKMLHLPSDVTRPRASLRRMPGVVGKALWVDFYQPNADEDNNLKSWFVEHEGFSEFKLLNPQLPKPIGTWEAGRATQFLTISREDDSGWVHLSLGQRMSPAEAEKDLATYPWKSEMQASRGVK